MIQTKPFCVCLIAILVALATRSSSEWDRLLFLASRRRGPARSGYREDWAFRASNFTSGRIPISRIHQDDLLVLKSDKPAR